MAKNPPNNRSFKRVSKNFPSPELSQELIDNIANVIRHGNYIETACAMYGVPRSNYYVWCDRARQSPNKESLENILLHTVEKALAEAEIRDLQRVDRAADGIPTEYLENDQGELIRNAKGDCFVKKQGMQPQWAAAAWKLERRNSKRWGRTDKLEHSGPDGGPVKTHEMTLEELKAERDRLRAICDDPGAE